MNDAEYKLLVRAHDEAVDAVMAAKFTKHRMTSGQSPTVAEAEKLRGHLTGALCAAQEFENRVRGYPAPKLGP